MRAPSLRVSLAIAAVMAGLGSLFLVAQTDPLATACIHEHTLRLCPLEHPYAQVAGDLLFVCLVLGLLALALARQARARR